MSDQFPVASLREAIPHLRRPFTPASVRWKIQVQYPKSNPTKGLIVAYLDARLVAERLNLVCANLWQDSYRPFGERVDSGHVICDLTIDGVTRSDVGRGQGSDSAKGAYSDALKRAAVKFGVGVSLYAMKAAELSTTASNGKPTLRVAGSGEKKRLEITPAADEWLRSVYGKWLASGQPFGEALDHGDVEGSAGSLLEGGEAPQAEQDDLLLAGARQALEQLYDEKTKGKAELRRKLPPGRFRAQLEGAASEDDLNELQQKVEAL